jgi:integrase
MRLTDITIRSLKAPPSGAVIFYDEVVAGFGIRVSEGGTKSFILTHGPRRERETLGRVGVVSLHDARAEAKRRLAEYTLGKERPRTKPWDSVVVEYLAEVATKRKPRTHQSYKYALDRHFKYGTTKLSELRPHDLHKNLDRLMDRPAEQQHAYVALRAFLRWAYRKNYIDRNPLERMRAPHPYVPRECILTNKELKKVWNAAGDDTFGRIVKTLILTGQRSGEVVNLTGSMLGDDMITIPRWLAKNSREHRFPLGAMAKETLNPPVLSDAYFFPAVGKKTHFGSFATRKKYLDKRSGVSNWRIHDLRRTFASGLASIGIQIPVIERLLNHISGSFGGIVGVYQRYDFMPEMKDAITRWEKHIRVLVQD